MRVSRQEKSARDCSSETVNALTPGSIKFVERVCLALTLPLEDTKPQACEERASMRTALA